MISIPVYIMILYSTLIFVHEGMKAVLIAICIRDISKTSPLRDHRYIVTTETVRTPNANQTKHPRHIKQEIV